MTLVEVCSLLSAILVKMFDHLCTGSHRLSKKRAAKWLLFSDLLKQHGTDSSSAYKTTVHVKSVAVHCIMTQQLTENDSA